METAQNTTNAKLSYAMSAVSFDATTNSYSLNEAIDYREPKAVVLKSTDLNAHWLYNSMAVSSAKRLFQFVAENDVVITPALFADANRLTVSKDISTSIVSYSEMMQSLTEKEQEVILKRADEYSPEHIGGVNLSNLLINDGTFLPGQLVKAASIGTNGFVGMVLRAEIATPVTLLLGKNGSSYIFATLQTDDNAKIVPASNYPAKAVAELEEQRLKYVASCEELAEELGPKNAKKDAAIVKKALDAATKAAAKLEKDTKAADALVIEANRIATMPAELRAKENPLGKKAVTFPALTSDESRTMRGIASKLANQLNVDKFKDSGKKHQTWASGKLALSNGFKATNNLAGAEALVKEVAAYVVQLKTEPAKAATPAKVEVAKVIDGHPTDGESAKVEAKLAAAEAKTQAAPKPSNAKKATK